MNLTRENSRIKAHKISQTIVFILIYEVGETNRAELAKYCISGVNQEACHKTRWNINESIPTSVTLSILN